MSSSNKRIAKNTIILYLRSIVIMLIYLYTSRVMLKQLGVDDYGIYSVIGGLVAMFSLMSNALSTSISRFITFEIGKGNKEKLRRIFSTSVIIQFGISVIVLLIAEIVAMWFINEEMTIPEERVTAAIWVLQCSLFTFCINLIAVPYNACIIAHEHMTAFAYISIIDVLLKLGICLCLIIAPIDKLVFFSILMTVSALIIRFIYVYYCQKKFQETKGELVFDKSVFKEMLGFSGWSFFTNTVHVFNNQGVNMLINVFFGVSVNAARGLATQVEGAVLTFVNNFTMAVNPQITKSYAGGDTDSLYGLICRGAKFSFFMMLIMVLPLICEAKTVLEIWLTTVPDYTVIFVQLSLIMGIIDTVGSSGYTACIATGRLKKYALIITPIGFLEFPFTWLLFFWGAQVVSTYYLYIVIKATIIVVRMFLLKEMVGLSTRRYMRDVIRPIFAVAIISIIPSLIVVYTLPQTFFRLVISIVVGIVSVSMVVLYVGMTNLERCTISDKVKKLFSRLKR